MRASRNMASAANLPASRPHKPTDEEMGPHNFGGGEAEPALECRQGRDESVEGEEAELKNKLIKPLRKLGSD